MEQETFKLLNVLRLTARAARYLAWIKAAPEATQFCVAQYNRILARLTELEPAIKPLFTPLSESASPDIIHIAVRELLAYFEADYGFERGCGSRRARVRRIRIPRMPPIPRCD